MAENSSRHTHTPALTHTHTHTQLSPPCLHKTQSSIRRGPFPHLTNKLGISKG